MIKEFAVAGALLLIAVLAMAWAFILQRRLTKLTDMYNELFAGQVTAPLMAWTSARDPEPAVIRISWAKAGTASYRVLLENVGPAPAEQLRFNLMSNNGYCPLEPEMMLRLFPVTLGTGEQYRLFALPSRWMTDPFHATVVWQDARGVQYNGTAELFFESTPG